MKKTQRTTRKLKLEPETVRRLTHGELVDVEAGLPGTTITGNSDCLSTGRCNACPA